MHLNLEIKSFGLDGGDMMECSQKEEFFEPIAALPEAKATEGITSTSFEIARPATIKCDSTGHKVSICQIDFTPQFEYQSVPKLVAHAFLKAKVKNQSQYALLAGPANVFLDNNFLTKSNLTAVSPSEDFDVSLGADPSVKITYNPVKKFRQTSGLLSKTVTMSYHQVISVKNTKQRPIKITVTDQLPKSTEEKIKVTLLAPELKITKQDPTGAKGPVHLNEKNNIEWVYDIPAGESKEINLKYNIDYPVNVSVQGI